VFVSVDKLSKSIYTAGIQPKDRLIREVQSHRPWGDLKLEQSSIWTNPTEIGTKGNQTRDLERSALQVPKPTQVGQSKHALSWFYENSLQHKIYYSITGMQLSYNNDALAYQFWL
jgi:hypothetical protein